MNLGTYDITIDFSKLFVHNNTSIYFKEGDLNTARVRAKLTMQGKAIDITGCNVVVKIETMTGGKINDVATIIDAVNGIVEINFKSNTLVEGTNFFELKIVKGESVKESPKLAYRVLDSIEDAGNIEGTNEYPILIQLINDTNKAIEDANEALELANTMKTNLEEVIDNANSAISNATDATNNANTAATNATSKITEVDNAKNDMTTKVDESIDTMKSDVNQAKNDMKITVDEAIKFLKQEFNSLTAQQQQELEVLQARDGEVNLNTRLERDLAKGKMHYETIEGSYISADDTLDSYLQNIEVKGNTIQNPNDLSDIKSVGDKIEDEELYKIPIVCCGTNINSTNLIRGNCNTNTGISESGGMTILITGDFLKVPENTTFSYDTNGIKIRNIITFSYDADKKYIGYENTIKSKPGAKFIKVRFTKYDRTEFTDEEVNNIRLSINVGEQSIPYEDYKEHKITILSPTPLEKVGDIQDRIIEKDGVWGVEKNNIDIVLNGNTSINVSQPENQINALCDRFMTDEILLDGKTVITDKLGYNNGSYDSEGLRAIGTRVYIYIQKEIYGGVVGQYPNLSKFKAWLKDNNINIKIPTTKPQFIPLPNSQQVKLKTFANKTNISFLTEVEGTIKADVAKSISASVNSNTQEISDLWDFVLKNNLANFAIALNTLDTKLKLEQLTKAPR